MDIDFKENNYRFLVRCSAIIINSKNEILLFKYKTADYYLLPGGRINRLEDSKTAIIREIKEELGIELNFNLLYVFENILKNEKIQNIDFCYYAKYDGVITPQEDKNQIFQFIDIKKIEDYNLKPSILKDIVKKLDINLKHFINCE